MKTGRLIGVACLVLFGFLILSLVIGLKLWWRSVILCNVGLEITPVPQFWDGDFAAVNPMNIGGSPVTRIKSSRSESRLNVSIDKPILHIGSVAKVKQSDFNTVREDLQRFMHWVNAR